MSHVRYIDKTRDYYLELGYETPYRWAHFEDAPFTPPKQPLAESRLALISTSEIAVRTWDDQRTALEKGEIGNVYSMPSDAPVEDLYSHSLSFDKYATTLDDVNAFFPITRLHELAAEGRVGEIAPNAFGVYNAYSQRKTREADAPEVLRRCREDRVDVALLLPVCPVCHQTVSLVSRHLEENGIPTVIIANARDIVENCGVARLLFTDFPLGSPCGEPGNAKMQREIVRMALELLESATEARTTVEAPFKWSKGEAWKETIFTKGQPWKDAVAEDEWIRKKELYRKLKSEA